MKNMQCLYTAQLSPAYGGKGRDGQQEDTRRSHKKLFSHPEKGCLFGLCQAALQAAHISTRISQALHHADSCNTGGGDRSLLQTLPKQATYYHSVRRIIETPVEVKYSQPSIPAVPHPANTIFSILGWLNLRMGNPWVQRANCGTCEHPCILVPTWVGRSWNQFL